MYVKMAARMTYKSLVQNSLVSLGIDATESLSGRPAETNILLLSWGTLIFEAFLFLQGFLEILPANQDILFQKIMN